MAALPLIACPAYVIDHRWDAQGWNEAAQNLFAGWLDEGGGNLLAFIFLDPRARRLIGDWEARAKRVVAEFRADYSRHLDDAQLQAMVDDLVAGHWHAHAVLGREGGRRTFEHPTGGPLAFRQVTLNPVGRPDLKLVMLTPEEAG
jgi:hypothetical protein